MSVATNKSDTTYAGVFYEQECLLFDVETKYVIKYKYLKL